MPILQITRGDFAPERIRATAEYLLAVMLWPSDSDRRDAFLKTCDAARRADLSAAVPGAFTPTDLMVALREALYARAPADWRDEMERRLYRATLVGIFYAGCWIRAVRGERVSVKQLHGLMTTQEWRSQHQGADIRQKTLEAAIREYRPSAPLWAAAYIQNRELDRSFPPCTPSETIEFLSLSEHVRMMAMSIHLQGRNEPLLPDDVDVWHPPSWLDLPKVKLPQVPNRK